MSKLDIQTIIRRFTLIRLLRFQHSYIFNCVRQRDGEILSVPARRFSPAMQIFWSTLTGKNQFLKEMNNNNKFEICTAGLNCRLGSSLCIVIGRGL